MKNLFLSAGIIAASAFALASCSQELAPATPDQGKPVTYTLNVATPETKTTVDNSWNVAWAEGDAITAVVNSTAATFNYANGNSFTTTGAISLGESNNWYLLYPSSKYFTSVDSEGYATGATGNKGYFNIPKESNTQSTIGNKSHLGGQLLYGVGTSTGSEQASVQMNHLVSVIRVKVTNNTSDAIDIAKVNVANDADARMSGTFYVNFTNGTTESSGASFTDPYAELSVSNGTIAKGSTGELYVPVCPFSLTSGDKVTVTLTLRDGATATYEAAVSSDIEFTAGHIKTRSITVKDGDIVVPSPYASNVTWNVPQDGKSYSEKATVNGEKDVDLLKIGSSKAAGKATIAFPKGTSSISFYAVAWNNKGNVTLQIKNGTTVITSFTVKPNTGFKSNSPYTLTVTESDLYTYTLDTPLSEETTVTLTTAATGRVGIFAIKCK